MPIPIDEMFNDLRQADESGDTDLANAIAGRIKQAEQANITPEIQPSSPLEQIINKTTGQQDLQQRAINQQEIAAQKQQEDALSGVVGGIPLPSAVEAGIVSAGEKLYNLPASLQSMVGVDGAQETIQQREQELAPMKEQYPIASTVGSVVGEAAPFAVGGVGVGALKGLVPRIAASVGLGAAEGATVSAGEGEGLSGIAKGAGIGGGIGGAAELIMPVALKQISKIFRKVRGREATEELVDAAGELTDEAQSVLAESGRTPVQFGDDVAEELRANIPTQRQSPIAPPPIDAAEQVESTLPSMSQAEDVAKTLIGRDPKAIAQLSDQMPSVLKAGEDLGLNVPIGVGSGNPAFQAVHGGLGSKIGSSIAEEYDQFISEFSQKADDFITDFGGDIDKSAIDQSIMKKADEVIKKLKKKEVDSWDAMRNGMKDQPPAPASNTIAYIDDLAKDGEDILMPFDKNIRNISTETIDDVKQSKPLSYNLIDQKRKEIAGKAQAAYRSGDNNKGRRLSDLADAMNQDQEAMLKRAGFEGSLMDAKKISSKRFGLEDDRNLMFGKKDLPAPKDLTANVARVTKALENDKLKDFKTLISAVPKKDRQKVLVSAFNDIFTSRSKKEQQLHVPGFDDFMSSIKRNKQSYNMIKNNMPANAMKYLDNMHELAKASRRAANKQITTGRVLDVNELFENATSKANKVLKTASGTAAKTGAAAVAGYVGGPAALGAMVGFFGRKAVKESITNQNKAMKMLNSPVFKKAMTDEIEGNTNQAARGLQRLATTTYYKEWLRSIPNKDRARIGNIGFSAWMSENGEDE